MSITKLHTHILEASAAPGVNARRKRAEDEVNVKNSQFAT